MTYTSTDLEKLRAALIMVSTGAQKVRFADGRETTFHDPEKILAVIATVEAQVKMQQQAASGVLRRRTPYYRSGL